MRAGPFAGFRDVVAFQRRIAALKGVDGVEIRQFVARVVLLRVTYTGTFPFAMHLAALQDDSLEVRVVSPTQIEVRISARP